MRNFCLSLCLLIFIMSAKGQTPELTNLPAWSPGYLDIYHINTGRGNASFFIFPDGTTMLLDAGDIEVEGFEKRSFPLKVTPAYPDNSLSAGAWISRFIGAVFPKDRKPEINYALISHFHGDHYGVVQQSSPMSSTGAYKLTGITEVGDQIPIRNLIDRGYTFPSDLKTYYANDPSFQNYLEFETYQQKTNKMSVQSLKPGRTDQIILNYQPVRYPGFLVRNIKSNSTIWSGKDNVGFEYFSQQDALNEKQKFNENPLSLALKISYGDFDYYTGGDNTGLHGFGMPAWFDVETPLAKAVGKVDALALNHHGNRDANNEFFLKTLAPATIVQQLWCSDQPGQEVVHRINDDTLYPGPRSVFALNMHAETKVYMGPWLDKNYKSTSGHVLIRVSPGGKQYQVFVLEGSSLQTGRAFGPYDSN